MSESVDSMFDQLVAGYGLQLQTVPLNDRQLLIDETKGEEFRTELFRIQEGVLSSDGSFDEAAVARLDAAIERAMFRGGLGIDLDEYVAVNGRGVYLTSESDGEQQVDLKLLYPGQVLVGKLAGVTFNTYPYVPKIESLPPDFEGTVTPKEREGLLMTLGSAMLCSTEEDGRLEDWFGYALVPLPEYSLHVQGAEIIG